MECMGLFLFILIGIFGLPASLIYAFTGKKRKFKDQNEEDEWHRIEEGRNISIEIVEDEQVLHITGSVESIKNLARKINIGIEKTDVRQGSYYVSLSDILEPGSPGFRIQVLSPSEWEGHFPRIKGSYHKFYIKNYENTLDKPLTLMIEYNEAAQLKNRLYGQRENYIAAKFNGYPYYEETEPVTDSLVINVIPAGIEEKRFLG